MTDLIGPLRKKVKYMIIMQLTFCSKTFKSKSVKSNAKKSSNQVKSINSPNTAHKGSIYEIIQLNFCSRLLKVLIGKRLSNKAIHSNINRPNITDRYIPIPILTDFQVCTGKYKAQVSALLTTSVCIGFPSASGCT